MIFLARLGGARPGAARRGVARRGKAWLGLARQTLDNIVRSVL